MLRFILICSATLYASSFLAHEAFAQTNDYVNWRVTEGVGEKKTVDNYTFIGCQVLGVQGMHGYCFQSTADKRTEKWIVGQFRRNSRTANSEHITIYWLDNRQNIVKVQDIHTDIKNRSLTSQLRRRSGSNVKELPKFSMTYQPVQLTGQSHAYMRDFSRRCQKADIDAAIKMAQDFEF